MNIRESENLMVDCADFIKKTIPGYGFGLIIFEFTNNEDHKKVKENVGNYISNANREDMIDALREAADRLEKNETIPRCQGEC